MSCVHGKTTSYSACCVPRHQLIRPIVRDNPGMPDPLATAIVNEAVALQKAHPDLPALQVLDLAMRGRRGTAPDFGASSSTGDDNLLDPQGPFGALLAAAFDEQITFSF